MFQLLKNRNNYLNFSKKGRKKVKHNTKILRNKFKTTL